jgi:hypothetical protein
VSLKGRRLGAGSASARTGNGSEPKRRHGPVQSQLVSFWCWAGHRTTVRLSADIAVPQEWECGHCTETAGPDPTQPPPAATPAPANGGRTPLEYLQMRRTPEDCEQILAEALDRLHASRQPDRVVAAVPNRRTRP